MNMRGPSCKGPAIKALDHWAVQCTPKRKRKDMGHLRGVFSSVQFQTSTTCGRGGRGGFFFFWVLGGICEFPFHSRNFNYTEVG